MKHQSGLMARQRQRSQTRVGIAFGEIEIGIIYKMWVDGSGVEKRSFDEEVRLARPNDGSIGQAWA